MKQRAVAIVAEYLSHRPLGRFLGLTSIDDHDYVLAIDRSSIGPIRKVKRLRRPDISKRDTLEGNRYDYVRTGWSGDQSNRCIAGLDTNESQQVIGGAATPPDSLGPQGTLVNPWATW